MAKDDAKEFRSISHIEEATKEGLLAGPLWTQQWGVKIYPWFSMDRVKFSFIEKGAKGKGKSFDVCVDIANPGQFDLMDMSHEVLHDKPTPYDFTTVLSQEKQEGEQYPKRYLFRTGTNGEKSVGICNSKNGGFCLNAKSTIDGKNVYANIPISYYFILDFFLTLRTDYEARRNELESLRQKSIKQIEENYKKYGQPKYEETTPQNSEDERGYTDTHAAKAETKAAEKTEDDKNASKPSLHVTTTSPFSVDENGDFRVCAKKDDGKLITLCFPSKVAEKLNENSLFDKLSAKADADSASFSFFGRKVLENNKPIYIFYEFAS